MLGRSTDGGATWKLTDLTSGAGRGLAEHHRGRSDQCAVGAAVVQGHQAVAGGDPGRRADGDGVDDHQRLLHVSDADREAARFSSPASTTSTNPVLYRSTDHGATFQTVGTQPPHIRAMSARGNQIYAAADNFSDGYALGVSTDDGATWQSVMSYDHVAAILGCVKQACQTTLRGRGHGRPVGHERLRGGSAGDERRRRVGRGCRDGKRRRGRGRRPGRTDEVVVGVRGCGRRGWRLAASIWWVGVARSLARAPAALVFSGPLPPSAGGGYGRGQTLRAASARRPLWP